MPGEPIKIHFKTENGMLLCGNPSFFANFSKQWGMVDCKTCIKKRNQKPPPVRKYGRTPKPCGIKF